MLIRFLLVIKAFFDEGHFYIKDFRVDYAVIVFGLLYIGVAIYVYGFLD